MKQKSLSSVAGIIDRTGGLRVVVTQRRRFRHHLGFDEQLFVVPSYLVEEPIPWNDIPFLIRRVELYIDWWIKTRNDPNLHPFVRKYVERPDTFKAAA